jgi:hypothetical protein
VQLLLVLIVQSRRAWCAEHLAVTTNATATATTTTTAVAAVPTTTTTIY